VDNKRLPVVCLCIWYTINKLYFYFIFFRDWVQYMFNPHNREWTLSVWHDNIWCCTFWVIVCVIQLILEESVPLNVDLWNSIEVTCSPVCDDTSVTKLVLSGKCGTTNEKCMIQRMLQKLNDCGQRRRRLLVENGGLWLKFRPTVLELCFTERRSELNDGRWA